MKLFSSFVLALVLIFGSALVITSCAPKNAPVTAPQNIDIILAKSLLDAQTAIEASKGLVATNPGLKDPLNKVIAAYNLAEDSYLAFHKAFVSGTNPDSGQLQLQIQNLVQSAQGLAATYKGKP